MRIINLRLKLSLHLTSQIILSLSLMFKRVGIAVLLLFAFALTQLHNFIPHHHDDELISHHNSDHQDKSHDFEELLSHSLGHLSHEFNHQLPDYLHSHFVSFKKAFSVSDYCLWKTSFYLVRFLPPPSHKVAVYRGLPPPAIYASSLILRGPPAYI